MLLQHSDLTGSLRYREGEGWREVRSRLTPRAGKRAVVDDLHLLRAIHHHDLR
jgi:hypothetical protein